MLRRCDRGANLSRQGFETVECTRIVDRRASRFTGDDHGGTASRLFELDPQLLAGFAFLQSGLKYTAQ